MSAAGWHHAALHPGHRAGEAHRLTARLDHAVRWQAAKRRGTRSPRPRWRPTLPVIATAPASASATSSPSVYLCDRTTAVSYLGAHGTSTGSDSTRTRVVHEGVRPRSGGQR
jgi:hypothetical protein